MMGEGKRPGREIEGKEKGRKGRRRENEGRRKGINEWKRKKNT